MFLPPELYRLIIENVDSKADLYRLLFVSRAVSSEAERFLYQSIHVNNHSSEIPSFTLFFHLYTCSRVAHYVQELEISGTTLAPPSFWPFRFRARPENYWHVINRVLCALTHLRVLKISTFLRLPSSADWEVPPPTNLFLNCSFKLEVLDLVGYESNEFPPIDLTQVKELSLDQRDAEVLKCHTEALPSLQILSASYPQFRELGASNTARIEALFLHYQISRTDLEATFPNVVSLKIHVETQNSLLPFPSLRFLELTVKISDILTDTKFSLVLAQLTDLRKLERLCIVTYMYGEIARYSLDVHLQVFAAIGNLKELIHSNDQNSLLWKKTGGKPVHIPLYKIRDEWKNPRWRQKLMEPRK